MTPMTENELRAERIWNDLRDESPNPEVFDHPQFKLSVVLIERALDQKDDEWRRRMVGMREQINEVLCDIPNFRETLLAVFDAAAGGGEKV